MGTITDFTRKQTPHLTPVVLVCLSFIAMDLSVLLGVVLKEMQTKSKTGGLDYFDFAILLAAMIGCVGKTIASFMNKSYVRWADEKDEARKKSNGDTAPPTLPK